MIAPLVAACAALLGADSAHATRLDTTYFVTNRVRATMVVAGVVGGVAPDVTPGALEYGFVVKRYRERPCTTPGERLVRKISAARTDSVRVTREQFVALVRAADAKAATKGEGAVLYVHGFGTGFSRAITQGSDIAYRGTYAGPMVVFSWPAHRAIADWPVAGALISRAYRDDAVTAAASTAAFRSALGDLVGAVRPGTVTVVGHSMGAQVVTEALTATSALRDSLTANPLRALVLFAPDIAVTRFRDTLAAPLAPIAARRVVYASSADRMLAISKAINGSARAGQARHTTDLATAGIEVVDVTQGKRADGIFRKIFEPRHAMRYASAALDDFFAVVRGDSADRRTASGRAELTSALAWRLTSAPIQGGPGTPGPPGPP